MLDFLLYKLSKTVFGIYTYIDWNPLSNIVDHLERKYQFEMKSHVMNKFERM